ncbi:hypothetical protein EJ08DRAFT_259593 [Tothia fuscella]|uniref:DH domain-containing protein n=1 Tax=Tothia fuscella TaxID=1048955 RepID=A0A9P4TX75_9PEZI|nr:hypothetical protein EJ08DRAFT_259593 [Tothia fuscella]
MNGFYDNDDATSIVMLPEEEDKVPARPIAIATVPARTMKRLEEQRMGIPPKAARRLGVDERVHPQRLAHIDEMPQSSDQSSRPNSRASGSSTDSRVKPKKSSLSNGSKAPGVDTLAKASSLDWSQSWVVFWRLSPSEIQRPPHGYSIGLQEMWWKLVQLEENYQHSLEMLHDLIVSTDASLPTCGITPQSIKKLQACHDKHLRRPLQACMVGPWTFDYQAIIKSFQSAHAHLVPLYERYAWDLPLVTFQVAAASGPSTSASRDLLSSVGPGKPTRYTCFRSPLTHVCATFDTVQPLYDGLHKGGPPFSPNYAQSVSPVREQLRSLVASCNRNILLRWDDLRRSNLFGAYPSRDIAHVMKELVFPPSQRRNIALLALSSPTRAVISRADLHWKSKPTDSWSKCHAILLNNYLVLASMSDSKGARQHQVYHLISLKQIATTTMSPAESSDKSSDKSSSKKTKAGKPVYHLYVRTPEYEHILGFATLLHCLEWHEHLDVALRGEMMDMPTGISGASGGFV